MGTLPEMTTKSTSENAENFINKRNGGAMQDLLQNIANFLRSFRVEGSIVPRDKNVIFLTRYT